MVAIQEICPGFACQRAGVFHGLIWRRTVLLPAGNPLNALRRVSPGFAGYALIDLSKV